MIPRSINIGTITGAISAHLALAEPTNKLSSDDTRIMDVSNAQAGIFVELRKSAPCTAKMRPRLDHENMATKCAAANARTR